MDKDSDDDKCLIYHVTSTDKEFILWCFNSKSEVICIRVPVQIEIIVEALTVDEKGCLTDKSENTTIDPENAFKKFLEPLNTSLKHFGVTSLSIVYRKEIYFYNTSTKPYIRVEFSSLIGFNKFKQLFTNEDGTVKRANVVIQAGFQVRLRLLESDIPPVWQFLYKFSIRFCSTIYLPSDTDICVEGNKISQCTIEYKTPTITPCDKDLVIYPLIFSFDIESYSHNHNMFPNADNLDDVVFFIGIHVKRYRAPASTERRIGLYLIREGLLPSDESGNEILLFNTEEELLSKFYDLICEIKPQIVLSFNGLGFDNKYIHRRMCLQHLSYPNFS